MIENKAQSGIGSMILFIAMLLVAAIGASTLIQTSGKIQEQAALTGGRGVSEAALKLQAQSVTGYSSNLNQFEKLIITVTLSPGAADLLLNDVVMSYQAGDVYISQIYYNSSASISSRNTKPDFSVKPVQGDSDNLLEVREVLEFHFWIEDGSSLPLNVATDFTLTITPKSGTKTMIRASTPPIIRHNYTLI